MKVCVAAVGRGLLLLLLVLAAPPPTITTRAVAGVGAVSQLVMVEATVPSC